MILSAPGMTTGGMCKRPVEFLDIYPTLADLCGLDPPADLEGVTLRPLLEDPELEWNRPAYTQTHRGGARGYTVRTERWRYTEWGPGGKRGVELYDHDEDPDENHNLAAKPEYADVVDKLRPILHTVSD